jgi:S-formylglutathione hydrolase FrmB
MNDPRECTIEGSIVKSLRAGLVLVVVLAGAAPAGAWPFQLLVHRPGELDQVNRRLKGHVLDYTFNHGTDRRIYSPSLCDRRDLYVYLPPCYDPQQQYPLAMYLHGFGQDERSFLGLVEYFDSAIQSGKLPPLIIAAPDGSIRGTPSLLSAGSFYVNSRAGRFEDYLMQDVWNFVHEQFPIRPERGAHAMIGGSMGGFTAYNMSFKYRDRIAIIAGFLPPLNLRYVDCHGRYFAPFDPECFGWRDRLHPKAPIARFYGGVITIRERRMTGPLFGKAPDALARIAAENPAEMLDTYDIRPGEFEMFVGYAGRDEFNIAAQVESFLYLAQCRGLCITTVYLPDGRHNVATGKQMIPYMLPWLAQKLSAYGPTPAPAGTSK